MSGKLASYLTSPVGSAEILSVSPEDVLQYANRLELVYCSAFGTSPWFESARQARQFVLRLLDETETEGFRLVLAFDANQLVGFACGSIAISRRRQAHERYRPLVEWLGPDITESVLYDAYELNELAVTTSRQGRGIGSRLHDELLGGVTCDRAWLLTSPSAEPAQRLYRSRGWQPVCDVGLALDGARRVLMARDLVTSRHLIDSHKS